MMQRKLEQERKQREHDERRSIAHIVGESSRSSSSRKRRQRDELSPQSDSVDKKKIGLSDDLDMVKQRLLDKADNPRIKTTVNVDSDAESEITLAPSMVLNEGTSLSNSR